MDTLWWLVSSLSSVADTLWWLVSSLSSVADTLWWLVSSLSSVADTLWWLVFGNRPTWKQYLYKGNYNVKTCKNRPVLHQKKDFAVCVWGGR